MQKAEDAPSKLVHTHQQAHPAPILEYKRLPITLWREGAPSSHVQSRDTQTSAPEHLGTNDGKGPGCGHIDDPLAKAVVIVALALNNMNVRASTGRAESCGALVWAGCVHDHTTGMNPCVC